EMRPHEDPARTRPQMLPQLTAQRGQPAPQLEHRTCQTERFQELRPILVQAYAHDGPPSLSGGGDVRSAAAGSYRLPTSLPIPTLQALPLLRGTRWSIKPTVLVAESFETTEIAENTENRQSEEKAFAGCRLMTIFRISSALSALSVVLTGRSVRGLPP